MFPFDPSRVSESVQKSNVPIHDLPSEVNVDDLLVRADLLGRPARNHLSPVKNRHFIRQPKDDWKIVLYQEHS